MGEFREVNEAAGNTSGVADWEAGVCTQRPVYWRLEEVRAELNARGSCFVTEFLVGGYAFFERLSAWRMGREIMRTLHLPRTNSYRVRWEQLDLSEPHRPQLVCDIEELTPLK